MKMILEAIIKLFFDLDGYREEKAANDWGDRDPLLLEWEPEVKEEVVEIKYDPNKPAIANGGKVPKMFSHQIQNSLITPVKNVKVSNRNLQNTNIQSVNININVGNSNKSSYLSEFTEQMQQYDPNIYHDWSDKYGRINPVDYGINLPPIDYAWAYIEHENVISIRYNIGANFKAIKVAYEDFKDNNIKEIIWLHEAKLLRHESDY